MATTRKYDNGANGWTDYNDSGQAVGAGTYNAPGTARNPFNLDAGAGSNSGEGSLWSNATGQKVASSGSNSGYTQSTPQSAYQKQLADYASQVATAAADAKKFTLKQAWEGNQQALNSQNATVTNNYQSAANKLTALQQARLPEYQAQKDATSATGADQLRKQQAINALGGKYFSGVNRSEMQNINLARENSLQGIQTSQNAFNTDIGNQMSEVDANRVAALNDIASKLSLGAQQYNDGTLNLNNQLSSDIATGSLKAMIDSQAWADTQKQLGIDNSARQSQMDQAAHLAELQNAFQEKQADQNRAQQQWENGITRGGLMGSFEGDKTLSSQAQQIQQLQFTQSLDFQKAQLAAEQQNQALNRAASASRAAAAKAAKAITQSSDTGKSNTDDSFIEVDRQLANGISPGNIAADIENNRDALTRQGINVNTLIKHVWAGLETTPGEL